MDIAGPSNDPRVDPGVPLGTTPSVSSLPPTGRALQQRFQWLAALILLLALTTAALALILSIRPAVPPRSVGCLACGDVRGSTGESWSFAGADTSVATMAVATGTALGI